MCDDDKNGVVTVKGKCTIKDFTNPNESEQAEFDKEWADDSGSRSRTEGRRGHEIAMNEAFMQELYFDAYCLLRLKETCGRRREISSNPVCIRQSIKLLQDIKLFSIVLQGVRFGTF